MRTEYKTQSLLYDNINDLYLYTDKPMKKCQMDNSYNKGNTNIIHKLNNNNIQ